MEKRTKKLLSVLSRVVQIIVGSKLRVLRTGVYVVIWLVNGFVQSRCFAGSPAPIEHTITIPSTLHIETRENGTYNAKSVTTDFVAYQAHPDGWQPGSVFPPRVAIITTTYVADKSDETTSLAVSVEDVSGLTIRQVSAFSDPGSAHVIDSDIFVTTVPACCNASALHRIRYLETGKLLFRSSGDTELGAAAWAELPNVYPHTERWAAFEAAGLFDQENDERIVGYITYGDLGGELSRVAIRLIDVPAAAKTHRGARTLRDDAADCGFVGWLLPGAAASEPERPAIGQCSRPPGGSHSPVYLWPLVQQKSAPAFTGFTLEFSVLGQIYATIPIVNDRFDPIHARGHLDVTIQAVQSDKKPALP